MKTQSYSLCSSEITNTGYINSVFGQALQQSLLALGFQSWSYNRERAFQRCHLKCWPERPQCLLLWAAYRSSSKFQAQFQPPWAPFFHCYTGSGRNSLEQVSPHRPFAHCLGFRPNSPSDHGERLPGERNISGYVHPLGYPRDPTCDFLGCKYRR